MENRWRTPAFVMAIAFGVLLGFGFGCRSREPRTDGRSLSDWIEEYYNAQLPPGTDQDRARRARQAILTIGTNGIPTLLNRVRSRDSKLYRGLLAYLQRHPRIPLQLPSAEQRRNRASWGFSVLGTEAGTAVPALTELLTDRDPGVRATAAWCLGYIGPDAHSAIPAMLATLSDQNQFLTVVGSMEGLKMIRQRPDLVIPALIPFIRADRDGMRYFQSALNVLDTYGTNAIAASPALQNFLRTNTVPGQAGAAVRTLEAIDPATAARLRAERR